MARPIGWTTKDTERTKLLVFDHLRKVCGGQDAWFPFNASEFALDRGVSRETIQQSVKRLASDGKLEYEGKPGWGYMVHLTEIPEEPEEKLPLRTCAKCGTEAPDPEARFCWKCGASLLSDRELLKEAFDRVFPKIAKLSTDSVEMNEIMTVIGKVGKMAFGGDQSA